MSDIFDSLAALGSAIVFASIFAGLGFWAGLQVKQQRPRDSRGRFRKA
jgi:hypothetical protein